MNIFLSYRRSDTQDFAARLADRLRGASGITGVFLDIEGILYGEDFLRRIRDEIARSTACLIVIGPRWLDDRLQAPDDVVRLEVREALQSGKRTIPVLANGAAMPMAEMLPDDLKPLALRNGVSIRHSDFARDADHLIAAVSDARPPGRLRAALRRHPLFGRAVETALGVVLALLLLTLLLAVINAMTGRALDELVGGEGPALLVILLVAALGAAAPWYPRRRGLPR